MVFEIEGKVALITGGASGLGLKYGVQLLRNKLKGLVMADINEDVAQKSLQEIEAEFGPNKAIFVKCDVTKYDEVEAAFKKTVDQFQHLDILINNAGTLNDSIWEKEIAINLNGTVHGMLLGLDKYLPKYKSGPEAVIVNISSIAGVAPFNFIPIYCATKFAIHGLTLSWGDPAHFARTGVRVIALCPGATDTPLVQDINGRNLGEPYEKLLEEGLKHIIVQTPEECAKAMMTIIKNAKNGTIWVAEGGLEPYQYKIPERESFIK